MNRILRLCAALLGILTPGLVHATPVTILNPSFEVQTPELISGQWTNNLEPDWKETGGPNNANGFMEWLNLVGEDGTDTLGMVLGHDVWQDTGAAFAANKVYTLNVKVGNRAGSNAAGNQSTYGFANTSGQYLASRFHDATASITAGNFAEAPALVLDTYADPCAVVGAGTIRVLLQARGAGRSHFDHIRLDVADAVPGGRPAGTQDAVSGITGAGATFSGMVTDIGSAAPSVAFYYDTADKGTNPASWANNTALGGTYSGAFSTSIATLTPATTYYVRARLTNASGAVWAAPCVSFTTLAAPPVVDNIAASGVGGTFATVGANVTTTGGETPNVTIYYGPVNGGTVSGAWASSISIPALGGSATRQLTGLAPATTYHFRAYAQNSGGNDWADASASFTTITVTLPVVENRAADNITGTSAVLRGEVTAAGNDTPVVTLYWGPSDGGTAPASWTNSRVLGPDAGDFSSMVQGLSQFTTYYYTARAVNAAGTAWAAPSRSFTTGSTLPTSVIINEIHYDPADPTTRLEFIELHNPTGASIDMSGWIMDDGVNFTFPTGAASIIPAGGYKVVVENVAAFTAAFPVAGAPAGAWQTGDVLSNKGERIRLKNAAGTVMDEVDYKAGFPWPTSAKGTGPGIELIHPHLNNDLGASWRSGYVPVGAVYVPLASSWRWRRGVVGDTGETAAQFTAWRTAAFVEPAVPAANAQWATNTAPFGYGENDGIAGETENTTPLPDMIAGGTLPDYSSIYLRKTFNIPAGQLPSHLQVRVRVDDAAIVWINGQYVGAIRPNAAIGTGHHFYNTLGVNAPEPPPLELLPVISAAAVNLVEGDNIIAIHALNTTANSSDFFIDADVRQSFGSSVGVTPGLPNAGLTPTLASAPPAIRSVEHTPAMPTAGQDVVISALITDPDNVGTVSLAYQIVSPGGYIRLQDAAYNLPANWITLPMNDAGTGGDAVAGDAVYSATVPGSVQTHRRLIRYRITAADSAANSVTVPYADDEQPNFAYFCYNGVPAWTGSFRPTSFPAGFPTTTAVTYPASLLGSIEPYHLIALDSDVAACLYTGPADSTPYRGTFIHEGKVYDHITFNVRGIGSTRVSGKNKLAFKFLRARDFQARDNWGRNYNEDWNSFGLDANASPWAAVHRGSAGVEDALSYRIFELGGMVSLRTHYVHFRIIRKAAESAPAGVNITDPTAGGSVDGQYTSDLMGLYLALEPTEANLLDERNLPDGNIYAIEGNGGDKKHQSTGQVSNGTDWTAYNTARLQAGQTEAWYRGNMDLPNLYTYIGLSRLVGNVDIRPGDNHRYYHSPVVLDPAYPGGHWKIMGYDHDMQFICATHWAGPIDGVTAGGVPNSIIAMMRHANIARDYRNRCREIMSLMGSDSSTTGGQVGQLIDEYSQMINPAGQPLTWADLDAAMWNLNPRSAGGGGNTGQSSHRGNFYRGLYLDGTRGGLGGSTQTASYRRELLPGGVDGTADHEAIISWFTNYASNSYPAATPWTRKATSSGTGFGGGGTDASTTRQKGYGWKYLEWECLHGGYFNCNVNPTAGTAIGDLTATGTTRYAVNGDSLAQLTTADNVLYPDTPVITSTGTPGYPVNDVLLHSSDYSDPQSDAIAAVQFRVGEISAPGIPRYDPTRPRIYEIEELWRSAEISTASPTNIADVRVPAGVMRTGHTYRARVRHKDSTGRWSFWSAPLQFVPSLPDVAVYVNSLRITEINYNPGAPTAAELASPGWNVLWNNEDFEFIELRNISGTPIDLTDVRFTKGINYDFTAGTMLGAGPSAVLVKNPAAFAIRYPGVASAGTYGADNLANGGEEVKLSFGAGVPIIEFTYDDAAPWPATPDGTGPTLVLKTPTKPALNHGDPLEWRASYADKGNPGGSDGYNYNLWAAGYPGLGSKDDDDDKDGTPNRLEYAFATNPANPGSSRVPTAQFADISGQTYATLTFTRRSEAEDTTFAVQFSDELLTWTIPGVLVSTVTHGDGTQTEVWRSTNPVSALTRLFGRVLVTTNP